MGRTVAVISLLGRAGHPGGGDPVAGPVGARTRRGRRAMRMLLARRSVRLRLTALYGVLFLLSGAVLLAITGGVVVAQSAVTAPSPPARQRDPQSALARAQARIQQLQAELAAHGVSHQLLVGSAIALVIMTVAAAVLGWIIAGRVLRPLRAITAATRRISADCASTTAKEPAATSTRSSCRSSNLPGQSGRTIKPAMVTLAPAPQPITRRQISRYAESAT